MLSGVVLRLPLLGGISAEEERGASPPPEREESRGDETVRKVSSCKCPKTCATMTSGNREAILRNLSTVVQHKNRELRAVCHSSRN